MIDLGLLNKGVEVRHGKKNVAISEIAQQFFCEMKVHLKYTSGDVESDETKVGKEIHMELLKGQKMMLDETLSKIHAGEPLHVSNFPVIALVDGVVITGIVDAVLFRESRPEYIVELKTGRGLKVFKDNFVQVRAYTLALERMGFDCSESKMVLIKVRRSLRDPSLINEILETLMLELHPKDIFPDYGQKFVVAIIEFTDKEREKAIEEVKWALKYWLGKRDPVPTTNANKCHSCPYKNTCKI